MVVDTLISLRAYARHREEKGLVGGSLRAVQQAIATGRLKECLSLNAKGQTKINSFELADQEWNANTNMDYVRSPENIAKLEAQIAASPPPAPAPSPPPAPPPVPPLPIPQPVAPPVAPLPPLQVMERPAVLELDADLADLARGDDADLADWSIPETATLAEANKATAIWKSRNLALEYAEKRRLLIPVAEVETALANIIQISKTKLLGVPTKVKGRCPNMTHGDLVTIESVIREALSELCDFRPQMN